MTFLMAVSLFVVPAPTLFAQTSQQPVQVDQQAAGRGEKVFKAKLCSTCHSVGKGRIVGPDLKGVTERRTPEWLKLMIMTPEVALAQDTIAQRLRAEHGGVSMPNMHVTPEEFAQLLQYLTAQSKK
jgi:mono/diheme cytochrome c family protein